MGLVAAGSNDRRCRCAVPGAAAQVRALALRTWPESATVWTAREREGTNLDRFWRLACGLHRLDGLACAQQEEADEGDDDADNDGQHGAQRIADHFVLSHRRPMPQDYYAVLGISPSASADEVKKAYRKAARQVCAHASSRSRHRRFFAFSFLTRFPRAQWHPDKHQTGKDAAEARFKDIAEAYAVLGDERKRRRYDCAQDVDGGAENVDVNGGFARSRSSRSAFVDPFELFERVFGGRDPFAAMDDAFAGHGMSTGMPRASRRGMGGMPSIDEMFDRHFASDPFFSDQPRTSLASFDTDDFFSRGFGGSSRSTTSSSTRTVTRTVNGRTTRTTTTVRDGRTTVVEERDGRRSVTIDGVLQDGGAGAGGRIQLQH